nr:desmethylxanthohumol 6'-O-methyltransferase-like [Tanacetum cinerariifolium]
MCRPIFLPIIPTRRRDYDLVESILVEVSHELVSRSQPSANKVVDMDGCSRAGLLEWILHDWSDDDCIKILKNCRKTISKETGKLIIVEIVQDPKGKDFFDDMRLTYDLWILHDWSDDDCIKILKNCRKAISKKTGKLIIVEIVQDPKGEDFFDDMRLTYDLVMFSHFSNGRERTELEWEKLLTEGGFSLKGKPLVLSWRRTPRLDSGVRERCILFCHQNDTMHERLYGKIRLYTRFFDYANFRLPLSTFLVDVLRVDGCHLVSVPIMLPYWNNHFFWVDDFACPASFPWHTPNHVTRDPNPVAVDFNAQDYATLVAHPSLFRNFSEAFLCLVGLSLHYTLDEETYPRFLHKNGEGGELEASVERLFDEGGSGNQTKQGDSVRGWPDANIQPIVEAANTIVEDAAPVQSRRQGKRKYVVMDAGGVSRPPKKLRE